MEAQERPSNCLHHGVMEERYKTFKERIKDIEKGDELMDERVTNVERCIERFETSLNSAYKVISIIVTVGSLVGGLLVKYF